jgi:diguanylate cyclase (GGDEF)-like protein
VKALVPRSLAGRIAVLFVGIILALQLAGFGVIRAAIGHYANEAIDRELRTGEAVFQRTRTQDRLRLGQAVTLLASDFGFRQAVATGDRNTIASALANHARRIDADVALVVDANGRLTVDARLADVSLENFPFPDLMRQAHDDGVGAGLVLLAGRAYQLVVVPVRAPLPIASLAMGFEIDDNFAADIHALTNLDVAFVAGAETETLLATSVSSQARERVESAARNGQMRAAHGELLIGSDTYRSRRVRIAGPGGAPVSAVLMRSLSDALAPLFRLQVTLLVLTIVGVLAAGLLSLRTARTVTRPVRQLARVAERIGAGDYAQPVDVSGSVEITMLSSALNHMRDGISERERRITDLAFRDALTGLPNRALFNQRLAQAIDAARAANGRLAVVMLDLDHFKYVNDSLGHQLGDQLLFEVGRRLTSVIDARTDTVARLGGDEFAMLFPGADIAHGEAYARRILQALEQPAQIADQVLDVRGSIGVVVFPDHGSEAVHLLSRVDMAMYAAKRDHVGHVIYGPKLDAGTHERLTLLSDLRRAVDNHELELHFQPKLDLATDEVHSVEALLRWNHPARGMVPPDRFIPFAEQTGFIKTLTLWIVGEGIRQLAAWHKRGLKVGIALNISARDLMNQQLPIEIATAIRKYRVGPRWLRLELTESAVMDDPRNALATLSELHALGLALSIDDFGTGYSSLSYLKRLPVDELKIDRSFVRTMARNKDDEVIVRSTIDLAHNMGLRVVAEGVEDDTTLELLRSLGCDLAQGYFMSKPLPVADFERWMRERQQRPATTV